MASRGAVATSDPRATEAAASVLRAGGNAVDAAVTAAFVLYVVEPNTCGVGGDAFLMVAGPGRDPEALDGSGALPAALTRERLVTDGLEAVPARGPRSATVPGAVGMLEAALARWGTMSLADAIAPGRALAADGFAVRPTLAAAAARAAAEIGADPVLGPLYVPAGTAVAPGDVVRNPALVELLDALAAEGSGVLYRGAIGAAIAAAMEDGGGYLDVDDLATHETLPMTPRSTPFAGRKVWELPLPTQGPAVLGALARLEGTDALAPPVDWTAVLDAVRAGMVEAGFDPAGVVVRTRPPTTPGKGDTTYLAVVDAEGDAASLITSVFGDFGSHFGVPVLGGPIHNRATTLRMLGRDPAPGKPPTTTIPAIVTNDDGFELALGVAGGLMQPQAQVQVLIRMLCEGLVAQAAIDAPRFKILFGGEVALEPDHPLGSTMPDALERPGGPEGFGAAQVAGWRDGRLTAGADPRRDGVATVL